MSDPILAGIQAGLDTEGEGWQVIAYVAIVGCERITDGNVEHCPCRYIAANQAPWMTAGLLAHEFCDVPEDAE